MYVFPLRLVVKGPSVSQTPTTPASEGRSMEPMGTWSDVCLCFMTPHVPQVLT